MTALRSIGEQLPVLREFIERVTWNWTYRRQLPSAFGRSSIFVSPSCGLKYLFRRMSVVEPELMRLALETVKPGCVVWDIGANLGLFSFAAAHLSGPSGSVLAFEPDWWLTYLLRKSASIQPRSAAPVQIIPAAIAATVDLAEFNIACRSRACNFLSGYGQQHIVGARETQTTITLSVDWLAERRPPPDILKIDVEGAEVAVLQGSSNVMKNKRPVIICEASPRNASAVYKLLALHDYRVFDGNAPFSSRIPLDTAPWSTLAIPA